MYKSWYNSPLGCIISSHSILHSDPILSSKMKITALFLLALGTVASVFAAPGRDRHGPGSLSPLAQLWHQDFDNLRVAITDKRLHREDRKEICRQIKEFVAKFAQVTNNRVDLHVKCRALLDEADDLLLDMDSVNVGELGQLIKEKNDMFEAFRRAQDHYINHHV
ncbi:hypothetical protein FRC03_005814 [Tulasnella sp. 419]|nr:hypothetical protein FRC03_005814 [Tulasnella sp. 419]